MFPWGFVNGSIKKHVTISGLLLYLLVSSNSLLALEGHELRVI